MDRFRAATETGTTSQQGNTETLYEINRDGKIPYRIFALLS